MTATLEVEKIDWLHEEAGLTREVVERAETEKDFCLSQMDESVGSASKMMYRLAALYRIAERQGWELPGRYNHTFRRRLRQIAAKQVLPDVYLRLQYDPVLMKRVATYPIKDQRRVVDNEAVPVLTDKGNGNDTLQVKPSSMVPAIRDQVFDNGRIRDAGEQRAYIEGEARRAARKPQPLAEAYEIVGNKVRILRPAILSQGDLIRLAGMLK